MKKAFKILDTLYRPNYNYKKIGVILLDLKQRKKTLKVPTMLFRITCL